MNRIRPVHFRFVCEELENSGGVERAYNRIFELAKKRMELDNKSTKEYIDTYGGNRNIFDTRGSSQKDESGADYSLPNVQSWENTGDKIWRSVENQPKEIDSIIKKERR